jgi:hypothetical protein
VSPTDWILLACIAVLLFFALRHSFRRRGEACGGECASCPYHAQCGRKQKK